MLLWMTGGPFEWSEYRNTPLDLGIETVRVRLSKAFRPLSGMLITQSPSYVIYTVLGEAAEKIRYLAMLIKF